MRKWLVIGVFAAILMAALAPNVAAATWIYYQGVWIKVGTLEVTSDWFAKNLSTRPAKYAVTVLPISAEVGFANPGGNLGGTASTNFQGGIVEVTLQSTANPMLSGKHDFTDTIIFGDCDNCAAPGVTLPQDGALWLMMSTQAGCDSAGGYLEKIQCVKDWLVATYEPNTQWVAHSVKLTKFDLVLRGWQDYNLDTSYEETVYAQYFDYELNADGTYTSHDSGVWTYNDQLHNCVWQYSYPKNLSGACDPTDTVCCDPEWETYDVVP